MNEWETINKAEAERPLGDVRSVFEVVVLGLGTISFVPFEHLRSTVRRVHGGHVSCREKALVKLAGQLGISPRYFRTLVGGIDDV